ncbi:LuxR C-terminal-related transcriptional regulator [Pseudarthrobacter sp. PS3-L1]|uniref:helix-turn-helix transcriptional regulator n=1 Tax=Pseudarthrobacter sp. PS3-L1 TaxID=3046207 RepID=UPI0024B8E0A7|nr:LuxR C-terminal-related transcriptional regulator [Pseudarthrobacter sp. PS3-L1]MDJ0319714.1 LuxR C-terminal-related transcriptional regulator [Pseudarthrobacter sp. PS3-L1]
MTFLVDRCADLQSALLMEEVFDQSPDGQWLFARYQEIVPAVLPDVLNCLDTGEPLARSSVEAVRSSAQSILTADIALLTVLHGGIPALRVFAAFLKPHHAELSATELATLLGRASVVATELAACWASAWSSVHGRSPAAQPGDPNEPADRMELVAIPGGVDDSALEMILRTAQGQTNEEIGRATDYSSQAVKWHLGRVMRSWKVTNRAGLVTAAFLRGTLRPRTRLTTTRELTAGKGPDT